MMCNINHNTRCEKKKLKQGLHTTGQLASLIHSKFRGSTIKSSDHPKPKQSTSQQIAKRTKTFNRR